MTYILHKFPSLNPALGNLLEGMILELEYLMDHKPESGAKQIALLHQYTRHTISATPFKAFSFV
jgi:hypothetical protein